MFVANDLDEYLGKMIRAGTDQLTVNLTDAGDLKVLP